MLNRVAIVLLRFTGILAAQDAPQPLGPGIEPPQLIHSVTPVAPHTFWPKRSTVEVRLVVDADGRPRDPQVIKSAGKRFDESALAAVEQYSFRPAEKDGKPIAVIIFIDINFRNY